MPVEVTAEDDLYKFVSRSSSQIQLQLLTMAENVKSRSLEVIVEASYLKTAIYNIYLYCTCIYNYLCSKKTIVCSSK